MTDEKLNVHKPTADGIDGVDVRDTQLEQALWGAYESMGPSAEQEERMLAALMEAQAQVQVQNQSEDEAGARQQTQAAGEGQGKNAAVKPGRNQGQETAGKEAARNRARTFKKWRVALPLAACLVLGAVVIGVANAPMMGGGESPAPSMEPQVLSNEPNGKTVEVPTEGVAETEEAETGEALGIAVPTSSRFEAATADSTFEEDGYVFDDVEFNTEEYSALKETGFVSTKSNPLSTVSADVDTASYCNLRRMINDGYALSDLPTGAVRIEEMLNYFNYDYKAPTGSDLFSMQAQAAQCPWNPDTQLLVLGFATAPESQAASKGSNLVFLIDVSGSMDSPDKLDLLQDSFATLLESLGPNDRVSIVTYASGEDIVLEGARGDDEKAIIKAIYKLRANGSTNGEAGLKQAYEVAERNYIEGGVNRIIMASDGDLNVGITSESDLYDFVDGKRQTGIYLSVLGFGSGNYKDNKMETLADHGNGSYHYIDSVEEAERVLKEKLTANLVPFADDVKVQVEFNPAQVKAYRLIGYENRELADEDFRNDEVDAGDVGPDAQFTVAYEIVKADSAYEVNEPDLKYEAQPESYENAGTDWLTCTMRYHAFDGDEMREQELAVDGSSYSDNPDANWNMAAAVIEFGMLARGSEFAGTSSEDEILDLLTRAQENDDADSFKRLVLSAL